MTEQKFDVAIIGGGPGGYVAAIRAAQLGLKTAVVEREHLGGICLNWGCIPTKALLRSSEVFHLMQNAEAFGIDAVKPSFNIENVVKRSRGVAKQLTQGIGHLMKKNKVTVIDGTGKLKGAGKVSVEKDGKTQEINATHIILATGARARELPNMKADGEQVWTYKHAMTPKTMPKSVLVIGSGAIGIEFASFYKDMGAEVTVVEMLDRILPVEDKDISVHAEKTFKKQGMTIITSAQIKDLKKTKTNVTATVEQKDGKTQDIKIERVILAIGITGNVEGLGLEDAGIKVEKGHVVTDEWGFTGVKGVYAIGDLTGAPWLAHKASHEGVICVEKIAGVKDVHPIDKGNIPGCTY
ncbi:MAG: dihydrolipoyl dehydrogenase, partial [Sphingomonadales bacterium]